MFRFNSMKFLPLDQAAASTSNSAALKAVKPMEMVSATVVEITADQYFEMVSKRKEKSRYAALERVVQEAVRKFARSMYETEAISNDMEELQARRRERARLQTAIRGGTATREDRQLFEQSKDLDDDYDELLAKESKASAESEKSWERLERSKSKLRDYALEAFFSHCYEVFCGFKNNTLTPRLLGRRRLLQGRRHSHLLGAAG
jgi:hypothetical protein